MNEEEQKLLIEVISAATNLPLQLEKEITNRRGAQLLKLSADGKPFALKIATSPDSTVGREAEMLQKLGPFVADLYAASGEHEGIPWLLQRWVGQKSVYGRVAQIQELPAEKRDGLLIQLVESLFNKVADLHQLGYLHGDLQPNHFRTNDDGRIYLLDFALAHSIGNHEQFEYPGALVHFSAPEVCQVQLDGRPIIYDERAELYSLASVVFFLLTGKLPADYGTDDYMSVSLEDKRKCIAEGKRNIFEENAGGLVQAITEKCLSFNRNHRFDTVRLASLELVR